MNRELYVQRFDSWGSFVDFATNRIRKTTFESSRTGSPSWTGTADITEAVNLASNGWSEGSSKANKLSNALVDRIASMVEAPFIQYDVTGSDFDVAAYLTGEPEHWYTLESKLENRDGKVFKIVFNGSVSAGVDTNVITAKGAAVSALVQILEITGNKTEIELVYTAQGYGQPFETIIPLKAAGQPLDLDRVIFALAHPSNFRRLVFSCWEGCLEFESYGTGYGSPSRDATDKGDIYFKSAMYGEPAWTNPDSATAWIIEELKKQGITVTES